MGCALGAGLRQSAGEGAGACRNVQILGTD